jgi:hypothetical protein
MKLYTPGELAHIACRDGDWSLKQRRRYGWELVIESSEGQQVGWYSGRHWLSGGTIGLASGGRVDLRRSFNGPWNLCVSETRERFARLSHDGLNLSLAIRSLPP